MSLKHKLQPIVCSVKQTAAPVLDTRKDKKEAFYRELHCKHQELERMHREDVREGLEASGEEKEAVQGEAGETL